MEQDRDCLIRQLRATLGRMEAALSNISEAIAWTDARGRIQWCNRAFDRLTGQEHIHLLGAEASAALALWRRDVPVPRQQHPVGLALEWKRNVAGHYHIRLGSIRRLLEVKASPLGLEEQQARVVLVIRDMTEQDRAEAQVRDKTATLELLGSIAAAANQRASIEETLQFALHAVCRFTGWPVGHVYLTAGGSAGLDPTTLWHLENPERFAPFRELTEATALLPGRGLPGRVLQSGAPAWIRDVRVDPNFPSARAAAENGIRAGFAFPALVGNEAAAVLEFFDESPREPDEPLLEVMRQIGTQLGRAIERHRAQQEVRRSEELFRNVFHSASVGMGLAEVTGRFVQVNRALCQLLGYREEELLGLSWREVTDPADVASNNAEISRLFGGEAGFVQYEKRYRHKLGHTVWAQVGVSLMHDAGGRPTHTIGQVVDITERKAAELALRKAHEKLEARVRRRTAELVRLNEDLKREIEERRKAETIKDELISTVSHELRTPLTSLRGFAELLLLRRPPPEKQQRFLSIIVQESTRLTDLINDFLDLQRMESGRQVCHFELLDLLPLLNESASVFAEADNSHSFRLTTPASLPLVRGDADRLRQVFRNLVSNAVKFSPHGGGVEIGARQEDAGVTCWVSDAGVGIPVEAVPRLFTKFYRVDNTETRRIGGTGLGLALVKDIIEAHGGRVWAESEFGKGSTFWLSLPAQ